MADTEIKLPFGDGQLRFAVPEERLLGVILPDEGGDDHGDERVLLQDALAYPIGTPPLREIAQVGQQVAIVISDMTRPCPSDRMLPPILHELAAAGIPDLAVTVVVALGLHRAQTEAELRELVGGAVYDRVRVLNHDPEDVVRLGVTAHGTPVEIFRPLVEADIRICLGNLEFHYFAGFSGGAKSILPGCASKATVTANHGLMTRPGAVTGRLEGNPVREDLEEGAAMLGVDFIVNAIVDDHHHIAAVFAGDVLQAHSKGCELVAERGTVLIEQLADIVLVSAGGYPLDVNMYQAQKALDNAVHAVRVGGVIVWVAECREGLGSEIFASWLQGAESADGVLERISREFVLGGHKAAAIATVLKKAQVHFVSALPAETVGDVGLISFADLDQAMDAAYEVVGADASVLALPFGDSVLPQEAA